MTIACLAPPSRFDYPTAIERVLGTRLVQPPDLVRFSPHHGDLPTHTDYDLVLVAGSQAHVTDPQPWFDDLGDYLDRAVADGTPVVGICFGHQFLASHFGGRVEALPERREGISTIERTAASDDHPTFATLPRQFESFVYHADHVTAVPDDASVLATDDSGIQAFALDDRPVLGVQFHPEFTPAMARRTSATVASGRLDGRLRQSRDLYPAVAGECVRASGR
ncbi:type 1 glutamine amidotransferase [Haloarchaeobius sp. DFWS5]|uniref:type 1 glutamine amidotransferase n=1 Tax=Haloarchaeobius sp. DFWS5 TaxID=3446114 RepID=UPI003EBEA483